MRFFVLLHSGKIRELGPSHCRPATRLWLVSDAALPLGLLGSRKGKSGKSGKSGKFQSCVGLFKAGLGDMTCHFMDSNM